MLLHRFAVATAFACYLLLLVGGLVHNTRSGLACGTDWPRCHGTFMPKMEGGVAIEHGHRIAAATVGLLTIVLAVALAIRDCRRRSSASVAGTAILEPSSSGAAPQSMFVLGLLACGLVITQGLLGALTVKLGLSASVSTAHLGTSMLFFALLVVIACRSRPDEPARRTPLSSSTRRTLWISAGLVYAQMLLGAATRHIGAGMICGDEFPLCHGAIWPTGAHYGVYMHILHRLMAFVILAQLSVTALRLTRSSAETGIAPSKTLRAMAIALPVLLAVQIVLGILSVLTFLDATWVTAHLAVAAAVFADLVGLLAITRPLHDTMAAAHPVGAEVPA